MLKMNAILIIYALLESQRSQGSLQKVSQESCTLEGGEIQFQKEDGPSYPMEQR